MSTIPTNASLGSPRDLASSNPRRVPAAQPSPTYAPGREALQALLAFSSLHEQIRRRRGRNSNGASADNAAVWGPEQFALDEVLQLVSLRALAITGTDGIAIALAEGDEIRCRASAGRMAPDRGARLDPNSGFSGACLRTGLIVRCDDSEKDPRVDREACRVLGLRSIVAVPLMTEGGVIGLLAGFCSEPFGFNDTDVRSLSLLAELILAALKPEEDAPRPASVPEAARRQAIAPPVAPAVKPPVAVASPKIEAGSIEARSIDPPAAQLVPMQKAEPASVSASADKELPNVQALRDALARVTEVSSQVPAPDAVKPAPAFPSLSFSPDPLVAAADPQHSNRALVVAIVFLVLLAIGGAAFWWRQIQPARQKTISTPAAATSSAAPKPPAGSTESADPSPEEQAAGDSATSDSTKGTALAVTGIRHWSSTDSSTVAIDLQKEAQYEAHRLTNPERIYFDLHDTAMAATLPKTIEVGDALLVRIRVAQPSPDVTRVVLETRDSPNFSVSMETNPYRLVVEIRSVTAKPKSAKLDLFGPMPKRAGATLASLPGNFMQPPDSSKTPAHTPKFRIVLDAGHGGWDLGTVGRKGLLEKNLVLDIVARLGSLVSDRLGAEVIYTRHDDTYVPLEQRTETANLSQADMFLSVHGNYSDLPSARGVETYYTNTYSSAHARTHDGNDAEPANVALTSVDIRDKVQQSRHFAERVQQSLYHTLLKKDAAVRDRGVKEASYVVLTGTTMPAVLVEVSFVSSPTDEAKLENPAYRQQIAEALYKGVSAYAESSHRVNMASVTKLAGQ